MYRQFRHSAKRIVSYTVLTSLMRAPKSFHPALRPAFKSLVSRRKRPDRSCHFNLAVAGSPLDTERGGGRNDLTVEFVLFLSHSQLYLRFVELDASDSGVGGPKGGQ